MGRKSRDISSNGYVQTASIFVYMFSIWFVIDLLCVNNKFNRDTQKCRDGDWETVANNSSFISFRIIMIMFCYVWKKRSCVCNDCINCCREFLNICTLYLLCVRSLEAWTMKIFLWLFFEQYKVIIRFVDLFRSRLCCRNKFLPIVGSYFAW